MKRLSDFVCESWNHRSFALLGEEKYCRNLSSSHKRLSLWMLCGADDEQ